MTVKAACLLQETRETKGICVMQENATSMPDEWTWTRGDLECCVQWTPDAAGQSPTLTWIEDLDSYKDERGNGFHNETMQPLADFLHNGPLNSPPLEVVEAMLVHLQAQCWWLDPYRLQKAALSGKLAEVEALLARGVEADTPVQGMTPFSCAVSSQQLATAQAIFAAGIDVRQRNGGAEERLLTTLATYAPDASWEPLAARMVAQGAELEAWNKYGVTPLMIAASAGYRLPGLVGLLLSAGANVNARSLHGYTPLWKAVSYHTAPVAIVQQLIAAGADVNACDDEGWSALMEAISHGLAEGVQYLLAAGADVQAVSTPVRQSEKPRSVLQFALEYANPEIIRLIQEAGAKQR